MTNNETTSQVSFSPELVSVKSSNIAAIGWNDESLVVQFVSDPSTVWAYHGVPYDTFQALGKADSVGAYFAANIKGKFAEEKFPFTTNAGASNAKIEGADNAGEAAGKDSAGDEVQGATGESVGAASETNGGGDDKPADEPATDGGAGEPEPAKTDTGDDAGAAKPGADPALKDDEFLLGSDVQPSTFALADGTELSLGEVVRRAFALSGLTTAAEWNALDGDKQEAFIQEIVDGLDLTKTHTLSVDELAPQNHGVYGPTRPTAEVKDGAFIPPQPATEVEAPAKFVPKGQAEAQVDETPEHITRLAGILNEHGIALEVEKAEDEVGVHWNLKATVEKAEKTLTHTLRIAEENLLAEVEKAYHAIVKEFVKAA